MSITTVLQLGRHMGAARIDPLVVEVGGGQVVTDRDGLPRLAAGRL